jgi:hypothetical protein
MEVEFNEFSENAFSLDVEGGGNTLDSAIILNQADFSGSAIPLEVTTTWDFANNEISYSVTGSATASETISADLSSITSVNWFRPRGGDMANGTVLDLDAVTISTSPVPEPSVAGLLAGFLGDQGTWLPVRPAVTYIYTLLRPSVAEHLAHPIA